MGFDTAVTLVEDGFKVAHWARTESIGSIAMPINAAGPLFMMTLFAVENAACESREALAGIKVPLRRKMEEGRSLESLRQI